MKLRWLIILLIALGGVTAAVIALVFPLSSFGVDINFPVGWLIFIGSMIIAVLVALIFLLPEWHERIRTTAYTERERQEQQNISLREQLIEAERRALEAEGIATRSQAEAEATVTRLKSTIDQQVRSAQQEANERAMVTEAELGQIKQNLDQMRIELREEVAQERQQKLTELEENYRVRVAEMQQQITVREREAADRVTTIEAHIATLLHDHRQTVDETRAEEVARRHRYQERLWHEVRKPLGHVRMIAENMATINDPDVRTAKLGHLVASLTYLGEIIQRLDVLARMETGDYTLKVTQFELGALIIEAVNTANMRPEAATRKIDALIKRVPRPIPQMMGDRELLASALHNILDNAIKYTNEGGRIEIAASVDGTADDPAVVIVISDDGIGIPRDDLPHIRQELYRASNISSSTDGRGLGLALVDAIIHLHQGTLSIDSDGQQGTVVTIHLPIRQMLTSAHTTPLGAESVTGVADAPPPLPDSRPLPEPTSLGVESVTEVADALSPSPDSRPLPESTSLGVESVTEVADALSPSPDSRPLPEPTSVIEPEMVAVTAAGVSITRE